MHFALMRGATKPEEHDQRKTLLITGCSSGIGFHAAHYMRARGWRVFASCRKSEDCLRMQKLGFESPKIDYSSPLSIENGFAEVHHATKGRIDALFNNGAYAQPGAVIDLPEAALRESFEANLIGWHHLTRLCLADMLKNDRGRIVNCSSVLGFVGAKARGAYVATKFALEGLTDTLRLELRESNIHIVLLQPGPIRTQIRKNSIPHYEKHILNGASLMPASFQQKLRDRLYQPPQHPARFEKECIAVSQVLAHALEIKSPHQRYKITTPTLIAATLRRLAPRGMLDRILSLM